MLAFVTTPLTVTVPPPGVNCGGLAAAETTVADGAAATTAYNRSVEAETLLRATRAKATVRGTGVGLGPMVTRAEKLPAVQLVGLCE